MAGTKSRPEKINPESGSSGTVRNKSLSASIIRGLSLPVLVIIIWQLAAYFEVVSSTILPSPIQIAKAFWELIVSGELISHLNVSLYRAFLGFLLGGSLGLLSGILAGLFRKFEETIDPSVQMLRTIPHLAITPLFILWFGIGETSKVLLIALGAYFPLYINTFTGIRGVDSKLFEVTKVLEFSKWKLVSKLIVPAALPNILLGLRLSIGVSWLGLVVAELMGSSEGVGYMINDARQFSQTAVVIVGILIFAIVGKLSDSFVRFLEKKLLKWRDSYSG
ncbi:ABC transporter permease [Paenibacillus validus]|uniref:ABC transporter permease subunit n=1 Tax=Paenibacillus validus TaxID=44253 RepID=A0A7X2ZAW3_9BACL|nr:MULTISPECIES: ABC transporter permease [Paenibacillus]MED4599203.1 ABC transporter permease [Paenibacillus validus]MED4606490.1 ABC transporter permease [Paenibacillus validus]MUG71550.1 ABC transporter permease subunit [Paenibacillus validus]